MTNSELPRPSHPALFKPSHGQVPREDENRATENQDGSDGEAETGRTALQVGRCSRISVARRAPDPHIDLCRENDRRTDPTPILDAGETEGSRIMFRSCSQNHLGRLIHYDSATITGVINRLKSRGLIKSSKDPLDPRRRQIELTDKGRRTADAAIETIGEISGETFAPLTREEFRTLTEILKKIIRR
ncbi:MarR family winged helix-turn-helix transcriptional regulator [Bradyrhizobium elkanii]|uniref:MarR family winged helix-turn-helix transcriptional regulator n=1 Tax=Bradyrhizobium elkanii TaxID=29448 RepID=UPI0035196FF1